MKRHFAISIFALFVGVALAGCTGGETPTTTTPTATTPTTTSPTVPTEPTPDGNETDLTEDSYELHTDGVPSVAIVGKPFNFTLHVEGGPERESDHVGAHFGSNSTTTPTTQVYDQACAHGEETLPGTVDVTCTIDEAGTFYLRGHARVNESGELLNFWSDEHVIAVREPVGDYNLTTNLSASVPTTLLAGERTLVFNLTITGDANDTSDHIGGHFGNASTETPSVTVYDKTCAHTEGSLPGNYTVTCTFEDDGTYYLRGHVRITADVAYNFWTDQEYTVIVV